MEEVKKVKEKNLELTNVLSDPTRYSIYEYLIEAEKPVTVKEVAEKVNIHSNVARLHLTKLTEVKLIDSYINEERSNGRPNRLYIPSEEAIEISFPYRDYKLLSSIALGAIAKLGEAGKTILFDVGKDYGQKMMEKLKLTKFKDDLSKLEKTKLLTEASSFLGLHASFKYDENTDKIIYKIKNCPFKELVTEGDRLICDLHNEFLNGMFKEIFTEIEFTEMTNMFEGCEVCSFSVKI